MREFADPEHRRLVFGGGLERQHKSNKRRLAASSSRGGLAGWDSLSPMTQHSFDMNIALPRIAAADVLEPSPWRLARLAPITWDELGPSFAAAFQVRHQRETTERGSLQSGAISRYIWIETQKPPRMTHVRIAMSLVSSRDVVANSRMSKVLKTPCSAAFADLVVCASIRCPLGSLTPKDELPRSEILELICCCFSLNNSGGAPSGVAPTRVRVKKNRYSSQ